MKRIIAMVRASTVQQSIEDQKQELQTFCQQEGYEPDEIEWVEKAGASAAKADDAYMDMIAQVKQKVLTIPTIEAFACWHLNRAFRNEDIYVDVKKFLVSHKIQMLVKTPYLRLLEPDGKVNKGMELAVSLLTTLAKQDQEERVEKFHRAKSANSRKGKFNGGRAPKYGYRVDENGYVVPDAEQVENLTQVYELYATGQYSTHTLAKELAERGIYKYPNRPFSNDGLIRILSDTAYIGYTDSDKERSHRKFIPIIDKALWDKVEQVRLKNYKDIPRTGQVFLGSKLLKCPVCGGYLHRDGNHYQCWKHNNHSKAALRGDQCSYGVYPPVVPTDSILWYLASPFDLDRLIKSSRQDLSGYQQQVEVLNKKMTTLQAKIKTLERRNDRAKESYIDGVISKAERDDKMAKTNREIEEVKLRLKTLQSEYDKTVKLIEGLTDMDNYVKTLKQAIQDAVNERNKTKMHQICQKYILSCTVERTQFGPADPRSSKPNALEYRIKAVDGKTYRFLYVPCKHQGKKYYEWSDKHHTYVPINPEVIK